MRVIEANESAKGWLLSFENPGKGDHHERRTHS